MIPLSLIDVAPVPSGGAAVLVLLVIVALILLVFSAAALIIGFYLISRRTKAQAVVAAQANPTTEAQAQPLHP
jgi:hypothetical protein